MAGVMSGRRVLLGLLVGTSALAGCDRAPWASPKSGGPAAITAATSAPPSPSAATPAPPEVAPAEVLATVNGVAISKAELRMRLEDAKARAAQAGVSWTPPTTEELKRILGGIIEDELASQQKAAHGKFDDEAKLRWVILRRTFLAQEWLRLNQQQLEVTPEDIQRFYDDFKLGFREPEKRQLRQITVASEAEARRVLGRLYSESVDFGALAQEVSLAPSKADGGLLALWVMRREERDRWFGREGAEDSAKAQGVMSLLDPAQEAAAFAIDHEKGLSNYVKGADGRYHIFQLVKLQRERQIPLEERREWIRATLLAQKLQQAMSDLRSHATIQDVTDQFPDRLQGISP
jgi:hypothetical protein